MIEDGQMGLLLAVAGLMVPVGLIVAIWYLTRCEKKQEPTATKERVRCSWMYTHEDGVTVQCDFEDGHDGKHIAMFNGLTWEA